MAPPTTDTAFEDWYQHGEFLRRLARRLVGHHAAEDLAQDAWLAALGGGPDRPEARRAWLHRVVHNLSLNLLRGNRRRTERERAAARPERIAPDEVRARLEIQSRIVALVGELDEPYRTTVYLRFYEDLPPRDIAARQQVPVHTVKTRLQRAIAQLRKRMDRSGPRHEWCAALLPLAAPTSLPAAAPPAALLGGIAMKATVAVGLAAVAVVLGLLYLPDDPASEAPPARAATSEAPPEVSPGVSAALPAAEEVARQPVIAEPASAAEPAGDWILTGRVSDPSGSPIAGARIEAAVDPSRDSATATSSQDGTYRLALDLPEGLSTWAMVGISARASADGHGTQAGGQSDLRRSKGRGQEVSLDFTLSPVRHVRGVLVDAQEQPAFNAVVALIAETGNLVSTGYTENDGAFLIPAGGGTTIWLAAGSAESGTALTGPHQVHDDADSDLGSISLQPHGRLEGLLLRPDGAPIPDTTVKARLVEADPGFGAILEDWLEQANESGAPLPRVFAGGATSASIRSDERGRFRLEGLAAGSYELELTGLAVISSAPPRFGPYRTGEHASITVESYRVHVRVHDQQGLAVPGADLTARKGEGARISDSRGMDADGWFTVNPGAWVITASHEGARPAEQAIEVVDGRYEYDVELVLDFEPATGEIQVLVTDDRQRELKAFGVNLWVQDSSVMVADFSDLQPTGEGVLPPVPTGTYKVRVTFPSQPGRTLDPRRPERLGDHFSVDTFATVQEGERTTLRLTAHRGARLFLSIEPEHSEYPPVSLSIQDVLGGDPRRIFGLTAQVSPERSRYATMRLGASGFSDLIRSGTYILRATADGYADYEQTIDVRAGEVTEVRVTMEAR